MRRACGLRSPDGRISAQILQESGLVPKSGVQGFQGRDGPGGAKMGN